MAVVSASPQPLNADAIRKKLGGEYALPAKAKAVFADFVDAQVAAGSLWRWGKKFWHCSPADALVEAAADQPVKSSELAKRAKGLPKADIDSTIRSLLDERRLFAYPRSGPKSKVVLTSKPEHFRALLEPRLRELLDEYAALGLAAGLEKPPARTKLDQQILEALDRLDPGHMRTFGIEKIRQLQEFAGVAKADFDAAALKLYHDRRVFLHDHSAPLTLPESEREELVCDGKGKYYVGICWREPE